MKLSEKIYSLRKQSGISQEQLAEQMHVSRQAISKWESGISIPDHDKLLAISNYFDVSVDYLLKENNVSEQSQPAEQKTNFSGYQMKFGILAVLTGTICLVVWGCLQILNPKVSNEIGKSSMIQMDGNGIFLLFIFLILITGLFLILKNLS